MYQICTFLNLKIELLHADSLNVQKNVQKMFKKCVKMFENSQ